MENLIISHYCFFFLNFESRGVREGKTIKWPIKKLCLRFVQMQGRKRGGGILWKTFIVRNDLRIFFLLNGYS